MCLQQRAVNFRGPWMFCWWIPARLPAKRKPRWACRDISRAIRREEGLALQRRRSSELPKTECFGAVFQDGDYQSRAVHVVRNREVARHDSGLANAGHCHANPRESRSRPEILAAKHISTVASCERLRG